MTTELTCEKVRDLFSALLDGELSTDERETVESHLALCSDCLRELDGLKRVDTAYRALPKVTAPENFESSLKNALHPRRLHARKRTLYMSVSGALLATAAGLLIVVGVSRQARVPANNEFQIANAPAAQSAPVRMEENLLLPLEAAGASRQLENIQSVAGKDDSVELEAKAIEKESPTRRASVGQDRVTAPQALTLKRSLPPALSEEALAESQVAEFAVTRSLRDASGNHRNFLLRGERWIEATYAGQDLIDLPRSSEVLKELLSAQPHLAELLTWEKPVVFTANELWHQLSGPEKTQSEQ